MVPMLEANLLPAEDSLDLDAGDAGPAADALLEVAAVRLPHLSNFDDIDPLAREPGVRVVFTRSPSRVRDADLVVLPGSKRTAADLAWMRATGLADAVTRAAGAGVPVLGICGGFQMLGAVLRDPDRVESATPEVPETAVL